MIKSGQKFKLEKISIPEEELHKYYVEMLRLAQRTAGHKFGYYGGGVGYNYVHALAQQLATELYLCAHKDSVMMASHRKEEMAYPVFGLESDEMFLISRLLEEKGYLELAAKFDKQTVCKTPIIKKFLNNGIWSKNLRSSYPGVVQS